MSNGNFSFNFKCRNLKKVIFLGFKILLLFYCFLNFHCEEDSKGLIEMYNYIEPSYDFVKIRTTTDTICFPLDDNTYNNIKSFNYFINKGDEYISFYDHRSESINIYNFASRCLLKKILLKNIFRGERLNNTTVFVKNLDSIYVSNSLALNVFDTSGFKKDSIRFNATPFLSRASFDNTTPAVFRGNKLFVKARAYLKETSTRDLKKWKVIYDLDIRNNKINIDYNLPGIYQRNIYGFYFFDYSYCYNDSDDFIFSFPADSNIYRTDLRSYNNSYFGKSSFQTGKIEPVNNNPTGDRLFVNYLVNDSYGAIYFDPSMKRYLRVARSKITKQEYLNRNWRKKQSLIVFDKNLKIIGDSRIDDSILLSSLFFDQNGNIYARTHVKNEYEICFVRLEYYRTDVSRSK